jgi:MoaA/NifB/PqqE/SkfB family radical SAM enzyme
MILPLDHPTPGRPHRIYFALTNHCNRSCQWCSTCSSPAGGTWLTLTDYQANFPREGLFQVQLEGGEPTIHPNFWELVQIARSHPRCTHLILCTNGVVLPRSARRLRAWTERLGEPLTVKLSINHHLLDSDSGLISLAVRLRDLFLELGGERLLVLNVRLRRGYEDDDRKVREAVEAAGLLAHANLFFLQRYGFAEDETGWDLPKPVTDRFTSVNPDGRAYGPDLLARSEGMRRLP